MTLITSATRRQLKHHTGVNCKLPFQQSYFMLKFNELNSLLLAHLQMLQKMQRIKCTCTHRCQRISRQTSVNLKQKATFVPISRIIYSSLSVLTSIYSSTRRVYKNVRRTETNRKKWMVKWEAIFSQKLNRSYFMWYTVKPRV